MFNNRNNLCTAEVGGQQENQELPTDYVVKNHVQDRNRNNGQKNLYTSRKANLLPAEQKGCHPGRNGGKD
jgi:hypothetical protein